MAKVQIKSDNFTAFGGVLTTETCIWQSWPLEGKYTYRCIMTNDYEMSLLDVVHFYNQRGEQWTHFRWTQQRLWLAASTQILYGREYRFLNCDGAHKKPLQATYEWCRHQVFRSEEKSRIKNFIFKLVSVPAKWKRVARRQVLNVYTT